MGRRAGTLLYVDEKTLGELRLAFDQARLKETAEKALNWELRNRALRSELLDKELLLQALSSIFGAISQVVISAPIPKSVKDDLLSTIGTYPLAIKGVAEKQTKQIHIEKGEKEESGGLATEVRARRGRPRTRRILEGFVESVQTEETA
jgi:hypothetical protein